jgi:CHAT domain-containing protein
LKKILFLACIAVSLAFSGIQKADREEIAKMFQAFYDSYYKGNLVEAEKSLINLLHNKESLNDEQLSAVYNNFGATYTLLGRYEDALSYYSKSESVVLTRPEYSSSLAAIYVNKAIIYGYQRSYSSSIEYFEKGIRIYLNLSDNEESKLSSLSHAYMNLGLVYFEIKDYLLAEDLLLRGREIKQRLNQPGIDLIDLVLAKTYSSFGNPIKAEEYFMKSLSRFVANFGPDYFRLAEVYFDYGLFLHSVHRDVESLKALEKALDICHKNYGEKHILVSKSYKLIGDNYFGKSDFSYALKNYQKSIIAVVKEFNDPDIFSNPAIDSSLFDIRLLDNLKSKSQALEGLALQQTDNGLKLKMMQKSLETVELALNLIETIRNNYMSDDSRIYLAENEKETYIFATHIAGMVYSLSHNDSLVYNIYGIAQRAKAAILRNEITGNDLLYAATIPDSLRERQTRLSANISAYNRLIEEEVRKNEPDSIKIAFWKDALFDMSREKEAVGGQIQSVFPEYMELIRKTVPVSAFTIQKQLKKDETIVDYLLSNKYSGGKRKLYLFLISNSNLTFRESELDSVFIENALILRNTSGLSGRKENYAGYTSALNYMYLNLIAPVENLFNGRKIIIIPDEEIGWLPFDAFIRELPESGKSDFEGLSYLINDFTFSFSYSSSLIFDRHRLSIRKTRVTAFSPSYSGTDGSGDSPANLGGALNEIKTLYKWFKGRMFTGREATKENFIGAIHETAIFHLAMHSMSDTIDSRYSYMLFDDGSAGEEGGRLYNYEISLERLSSPMVVLSACNSGTGTLYSGEGLMSLARSFILAGASSVIKTAWEVNDEASSDIIISFYKYLASGMEKNQALRLAKIDYLDNVSPVHKNPYYWAAYEVLGDNSPVVKNKVTTVILLTVVVGLIFCGIVLIYFRRRRSFFEGSL